jgi:peptide/nickel transport system substrate-binding protein
VDYYEQVPGDLAPVLAQSPGIVVEVLDPLGNQGMLRMNHLLPPFDKAEARQAVAMAMDQTTYMQAAVGNPDYFQTCFSLYACGSPLASEEGYGPYKERNVEQAKALIEQAGYTGHRVVLMDPTDVPILHAASLVTAQNLREVGFDVDVQAMDWSTLTSRRAKKDPVDQGGWNVFHTWWIGGDIANPISHVGLSGGGPERAWFGWPGDETLEQLRDAFSKETDVEKQKALATEIQVRSLELVTHGNFGTFFVPVGYRDNIKGLIKSPVQFFWNVEKL